MRTCLLNSSEIFAVGQYLTTTVLDSVFVKDNADIKLKSVAKHRALASNRTKSYKYLALSSGFPSFIAQTTSTMRVPTTAARFPVMGAAPPASAATAEQRTNYHSPDVDVSTPLQADNTTTTAEDNEGKLVMVMELIRDQSRSYDQRIFKLIESQISLKTQVKDLKAANRAQRRDISDLKDGVHLLQGEIEETRNDVMIQKARTTRQKKHIEELSAKLLASFQKDLPHDLGGKVDSQMEVAEKEKTDRTFKTVMERRNLLPSSDDLHEMGDDCDHQDSVDAIAGARRRLQQQSAGPMTWELEWMEKFRRSQPTAVKGEQDVAVKYRWRGRSFENVENMVDMTVKRMEDGEN